MGRQRKAGDWVRFFTAVESDVLQAVEDHLRTETPFGRVLTGDLPSSHRDVGAKAIRTFARAMDRGLTNAELVKIEGPILEFGVFDTFTIEQIGETFRQFLVTSTALLPRVFSRRSPERLHDMSRRLSAAIFDAFVHLASTRVRMDTDDLQQSRSRFRAMLEAAGEAILDTDANGIIRFANRRAGEVCGTPPRNLRGVRLGELLATRGKQQALRRLKRALKAAADGPATTSLTMQRLDGGTFKAEINVASFEQRANQQFLVVLRDVSEAEARTEALRTYSKQLEIINDIGQSMTATFERDEILHQILTRAQSIVPCAAASLLLVEPNGSIVFHEALGPKGDAVKQLVLRPGQGLAGWVIQHGETAVLDDAKADGRLDHAIEAAVNFPVRTVLCTPLRREGIVLGAIELLNRRGGAFTRTDVELVEAFAAFASIALHKAALFQERSSLQRRLLQAEAATHAGRLASTIAQEMIDPVTIIQNNLEIWERDPMSADTDSLQVMQEELERLRRILRQLVDYSNATAEAVRATPVPLLLDDVMQSLQPEIKHSGVRVEVRRPARLPLVDVVPGQLVLALINLIRHAIAVTPRGDTVEVHVRRAKDRVSIAVTDEGAPLTQSQITTLFDPTAVQRGILAKGLDLYIAGAIVRHQGSELRGRSEGGVGTTFSFSLPISTGEEGAWQTQARAS